MSERTSNESVGRTNSLLNEHSEAMYHWQHLADTAQKIEAAREALEHINNGLNRETHRFVTATGNVDVNVYRRDPMGGTVELRSSINLVGGHTKIIGDHLEEVDGQLVLFDTELGIGFSSLGVRAKSIEDLEYHDTFRLYSDFLEKVSKSPAGIHTNIDCMD